MATETIKDIADYLESLAPLAYQEDYDNCGLIIGNQRDHVTGILIALDCTEAVVDEAIATSCNLIVAHHPILFKGIKKLTGGTYVESVIIKAIQHRIGIYAIHTNLDNVLNGVNKKIASRIGLANLQILQPKRDLMKLVTFIPKDQEVVVTANLHKAGAGQIGNYKNCSFSVSGKGRFTPGEGASPVKGALNQPETVEEVRVEVIFSAHLQRSILNALRESHPYEEVAYYLSELQNENLEVGAGLVGELEVPEDTHSFLHRLKSTMNTGCIRHTKVTTQKVQKIAICGGSGSFLLQKAIAHRADVFISSDFKYHEFFDANGKIIIADIGHYESEQFTKELIGEFLREKFPTFAIAFSKVVTNPISYL
ncbi:MAG: Nif3-like dinuclear metal center hexameric protein [Cyclobacteriaceae bacterium]|nr:Nif3-like dinuclear metal center hexameric protein [Cyclobacteriaceae bacterium]